ncbi:hypothetical protein CANCADRAFT_26779 [Tortispora caseinolytica NRRL Y-17796]|uniref:Deoxycytidylate deaminase n=1 Tax=Tortispora caseinolytica NRRL Y-17796 TaxID=767744 RepID=A0A1E4THN9_9ASCO|nr:hypothetical protein CANCADRAFT_26779 [Tortispora caseinolytica NRRL Y-17796]
MTLYGVESESDRHVARCLKELKLKTKRRYRPSWDDYFMKLAYLAAERSNCVKRRVGCVLTRDKRVIATGYNGTPKGMENCSDGGCPRCNATGNVSGTSLDRCLCLHAEENTLLEAGRERIGEGAILYCDTCPCLTCAIKIVQCGISEVVYAKKYATDSESLAILSQGGVTTRIYSRLPEIAVV